MELVEGDDLSQRIARGALPLDEALPIARQIAEALEAAHEQGIVHRDLKPANIKVRPDGVVKVLDFGLAKALDPIPASSAEAMNSPTFTRLRQGYGEAGRDAGTEMGMILGTAAYMAPEQAKGRPVDKRADIWAFGAVLYELLTGERAFKGEDISDTLAAVLRQEITLSALPASTPARLTRLIGRCLERDPKQRLRDIGEARIELARLEAGGADVMEALAAAAAGVPALVVAAPVWRRALPWALVAGLLMTLGAVFVRDRASSMPTPAVIMRVQIALPPSVELYTFNGGSVSLSPNGSILAFVGVGAGDGVRRVYTRKMDRFEITPVRGTDKANGCEFSPNGRELLVAFGDSSLRRIRLSDGLNETVTPNTKELMGAAWLPDGRLVFSSDGRLWMSGETPGAAPTQLTEARAASTAEEVQPVAVPGGQAVLFVSARPEAPGSGRIEALTLADKVRTPVVERASRPVLTRTGHLLFLRDGVLLAAPFDVGSLKTTSDPTPVLTDLRVVGYRGASFANMTVSDAGVLVYVSTTAVQSEIVSRSVSRTREEQILLGNQREVSNPRMSPIGQRLLFEEFLNGLWVWDPERPMPARIAAGNMSAQCPIFTRDGREVIFHLPGGLFRQPLEGGARPVQIAGSDADDWPTGTTANDAEVLYTKIAATTSGDICALPLAGGKPRVLVSTPAYEGGAQISPDGRWMVYVSNEVDDVNEIFLKEYRSLERRWQVSAGGGTQPVWNPMWNPKGGEILYRSGDKMMSVRLTVTPTGPVRDSPVPVFSGRYAFGGGFTIPNFGMTHDGQRVILVKRSGADLNVVLNWFEELMGVK
jgi:Tol biopolymer transport system component